MDELGFVEGGMTDSLVALSPTKELDPFMISETRFASEAEWGMSLQPHWSLMVLGIFGLPTTNVLVPSLLSLADFFEFLIDVSEGATSRLYLSHRHSVIIGPLSMAKGTR